MKPKTTKAKKNAEPANKPEDAKSNQTNGCAEASDVSDFERGYKRAIEMRKNAISGAHLPRYSVTIENENGGAMAEVSVIATTRFEAIKRVKDLLVFTAIRSN